MGGVGFRIDLRNEEVFVRIDKAMDRVLESDSGGSLTISVAPKFAVKWLVSRLQRFDALRPDIDLRISSSLRVTDFQRDAFCRLRKQPKLVPPRTPVQRLLLSARILRE